MWKNSNTNEEWIRFHTNRNEPFISHESYVHTTESIHSVNIDFAKFIFHFRIGFDFDVDVEIVLSTIVDDEK